MKPVSFLPVHAHLTGRGGERTWSSELLCSPNFSKDGRARAKIEQKIRGHVYARAAAAMSTESEATEKNDSSPAIF